jgi:hypothetical protein
LGVSVGFRARLAPWLSLVKDHTADNVKVTVSNGVMNMNDQFERGKKWQACFVTIPTYLQGLKNPNSRQYCPHSQPALIESKAKPAYRKQEFKPF